MSKLNAYVEPTIGHLKSNHRLERNRPKDAAGDAINAILSATALNFLKRQGFFWYFCLSLLASLSSPLPRSSTALAAKTDFSGPTSIAYLSRDGGRRRCRL